MKHLVKMNRLLKLWKSLLYLLACNFLESLLDHSKNSSYNILFQRRKLLITLKTLRSNVFEVSNSKKLKIIKFVISLSQNSVPSLFSKTIQSCSKMIKRHWLMIYKEDWSEKYTCTMIPPRIIWLRNMLGRSSSWRSSKVQEILQNQEELSWND